MLEIVGDRPVIRLADGRIRLEFCLTCAIELHGPLKAMTAKDLMPSD